MLCDWSCSRWQIEGIDGWLAVGLAVEQPDGDPFRCYVHMPTAAHAGEVSDWGELKSALYLHGIHGSSLITQRAVALGLRAGEHGILSRVVRNETEVALAVSAFQQLASIAAAELDTIRFSPPSMVLPAVWANIATKILSSERKARVVADYAAPLAPKPLGKHMLVALHEKEPILASPYLRAESPTWYHSLYYFINEASGSVKSVVPLVRVSDRRILDSSDRVELERTAQAKGRYLDFVTTEPKDARFDPETHDYPGMRVMQEAGPRLLVAYDEALRRAA